MVFLSPYVGLNIEKRLCEICTFLEGKEIDAVLVLETLPVKKIGNLCSFFLGAQLPLRRQGPHCWRYPREKTKFAVVVKGWG